ncbi:hypothetical protein [Paenibacillus lutimineralis]|uniref:Uncharacterized protein n=1 Tax=Paenibacillus lutimineralis TaxID=2707005 RepID=A0A3Q9I5S2_9BACL|nr:hypothetical protein [Paenibacillus lutimineralis]AZS13305.1 hypothetical protein EI981_01680 [Paenibacillus lutimineralis]
MKKGSRDSLGNLFKVVKKAADSVEAKFIEKLSHEVGEPNKCPLVKEYKEYLKSTIVKSGLRVFDEVSKRVTPTSNRYTSTKMVAQKTQAVQEAQQESKEMSLEDSDRLIGVSK